MKEKIDYAKCKIVQDTSEKELIESFEHMLGSKVIDIGFIEEQSEGGLTIDYMKDDKKYRLVIGFNELGMWQVWQGKGLIDEKEEV